MRYEFADCLLDTESFKLFRGGEQQAVEPQVFDLLLLLAEQAGRLVSRDLLVEQVWGGRIVSEATISARINAARTAVGDNGKTQAVIRTVPRRGIELVVPVQIAGENAGAPASQPDAPHSQTIRYRASADGTQIAFGASGQADGVPLLRASHHVTHLEMDWASPFWRPLFDALGARHRLIRYDMRGTGLSDGAGPDHDIARHVEDLASVADAAGLARFSILANLNSAAVAIRYAAENPDRVSKLVIQQGYARGRALRGDTGPSENDPFVNLLRGDGWGDPQNGYMRAWMSMTAPTLTYDEATAMIGLIAAASSISDVLASRQTIDRFDARPYLARVQAPTLVIHARNDIVHPLAEGRVIAAGIPGAEFRVVESANTLCVPSDPTWAEQTSAILEFLSRLA